MKTVQCNKCDWVYFEVDADYVNTWKKEWDYFWPNLSEEGKANYGAPDSPPSVEQYLFCGCGNIYTNFRDSTKVLRGSTVSPILARTEKLK